jgi:hypothetical protein
LAEVAFLRSLSPARREAVIKRLWAVLEAEAPTPDINGIAETAGLSRTAFFGLRRRWSAQRTLRSLAPYQPRRPVEPSPTTVQSPLPPERPQRHGKERAAALEAIRADPLATNGVIADIIASRLASDLDRRTLVGIVRQERRLLHFKPTNLLGVYGRSLLADVSALDLLIEHEGQQAMAVLAVIIERASTLILGHAVGVRERGIELQVLAAERSVTSLAAWRADVSMDTLVAMQVVVGPGPEESVQRLAETVEARVGPEAVHFRGRLRFGRRMASLIGQPGRVRLRPMATMPSKDDPAPSARVGTDTLSVAEADALLGVEIERHNRSALTGLRMVGLVGQGEVSGAMGRLICDIFGAPDGR